jgi:hypothetical protein
MRAYDAILFPCCEVLKTVRWAPAVRGYLYTGFVSRMDRLGKGPCALCVRTSKMDNRTPFITVLAMPAPRKCISLKIIPL